MGRAGLRAQLLATAAAALLPLAAASPAAAAGASWGSAASAPAEVEGQQECEHAAMRVEALQKGSALAGAAPSLSAEGASAGEIAAEGNPYAPGPNLYLASLVDKENYRGYCLDIAGSPPHPQCGNLQGHSCKSEGEDTQFVYDALANQVRSVNFNRACNPLYSGTKNNMTWSADENNTEPACVTANRPYAPGSTFSLTGCGDDILQRITYTSSRQLQVGPGSLCLVLGMDKTAAYEDYLLRTAELRPCDTWPAELSTWEALLPDHTKLREVWKPPPESRSA